MEIDFSRQLFYTAMLLAQKADFSGFDFESPGILANLSTVNIFVGANNSGKSRFLRTLFRTTDPGFKTNFFKGDEFRNYIRETNSQYVNDAVLEKCKNGEFDPPLTEHFQRGNRGFFIGNGDFKEQLRSLVLQWQQFAKNSVIIGGGSEALWMANLIDRFYDKWRGAVSEKSFQPQIGQEPRIYIPILRGMRPLPGANTNQYYERTISDYFPNLPSNFSFEIFSGLELYKSLKDQLLGEPHDRSAVRDFESFLKNSFFDGKEITLIPREGKDVVHVKIGSEAQYPIYSLGDGLQNLIIVTYKIFMTKSRSLFFIEEPDLSMHPGMQRALLEEMTRRGQHQYFLTTHSNHLLDMSSEFKNLSIYLFSKTFDKEKAKFKVNQVSSPDSNILRELGVHNSSVFLTNATIWIEGITDRLYIKAYLKKHLEQTSRALREDYHYSFVEYQGSNLTHWTFDANDQSSKIKANFLCGHSFLIADGDVSNKGARSSEYSHMLGDRFYVLSCKEIENLLPPEVLKEVVKEAFRDANRDVEAIDYAQYSTSHEGIGKYLDGLLGKEHFASETGTLKSKVNFCEKAFDLMTRPDFEWQLTPPLTDLCEKLRQFVLKQNA